MYLFSMYITKGDVVRRVLISLCACCVAMLSVWTLSVAGNVNFSHAQLSSW